MSDKVVVITGAGSGLGREYALAFAAQGAKVVVNDFGAAVSGDKLDVRPADIVVDAIRASGAIAVANSSDVSDWDGAADIIESAIREFGRLDVVINNAGINRPSSLIGMTKRDLDAQIDVHLKGTLAVSHFAAAHWNKVGPEAHRAIVNTTSAVGLHPTAGDGIYGAAKAGIAAATVSHSQDLARLGVRVNAIAPCARTRMVVDSPSVLALMPEQEGFDRHDAAHVAPLVVYLASPLSKFTGRIFAIEGPDVAIYQPFHVEQDWSCDGPWTPESLSDAFTEVDERAKVTAFFPGGTVSHSVPSGRTLRALQQL